MSQLFNKRLSPKQNLSGFTLLEVLVSLTILAIISIAAITSLTQFLKSRERIDVNQAKIEALNSAFLFLERDLSYTVPRPTSDNNNNLSAAMEVYLNNPKHEGELLQFTTAYPIPGTTAQRTERVSWRLLDDNLYRYRSKLLDQKEQLLVDQSSNNEQWSQQKMLDNVRDVNINVFMVSGKESSRKFLNESVVEGETSIEQLYNLPRLLEFNITLNNDDSYRRLFYIQSRYFELGREN